jgi:hypothetical protein
MTVQINTPVNLRMILFILEILFFFNNQITIKQRTFFLLTLVLFMITLSLINYGKINI